MTTIDVLFSEADIAARVQGLADEIAASRPRELLVVPLLKGSFIFAADLVRALHRSGLSPHVDFLTLSSYGGDLASSGNVRVLRDVESPVKDRDVLVIDDILESGRTLKVAREMLQARGANRVMTCVLLDKPGRRAAVIDADHVGFDCPDLFVVGYGMDAGHAHRELPFVGVVKEDAS
ncbi:MAG: hypoxanthine phosphoribosyltransferase [Pseudomonadota bacterium]